jgi:DNA-binding MurR/RpiR family transcriptional regulator
MATIKPGSVFKGQWKSVVRAMKPNERENEIGCFIRIKNLLPYLSDSERKVAEYILENPRKVIMASGIEIANEARVSVSTVSRFCKRSGYDGFPQLKIILSRDLAEPLRNIHEDIEIDDTIEIIKRKITNANISAMESSLHVLNSDDLQKAVDCLLNAETIYFFGMGGSGYVALDAQHKFLRTGKKCFAYVDKHMQLICASMFGPQNVVVACSHSGTNKDILEVIAFAQEKGAEVIAITNYVPSSPLAKRADICLFTSSKETVYRPLSLSSRIAALTIIDILYVAVGLRLHLQTSENLKKIREAIARTRV